MGIYALVIKTWLGPSFPAFSPAYSPFIYPFIDAYFNLLLISIDAIIDIDRSINFGDFPMLQAEALDVASDATRHLSGRVTGCGQVSSFRILKGLCMAMPFRPTWPHLSLHVVHMNLNVVFEIFYWDFRAEDAFKSHMGKWNCWEPRMPCSATSGPWAQRWSGKPCPVNIPMPPHVRGFTQKKAER